jgi:hypothetical protein
MAKALGKGRGFVALSGSVNRLGVALNNMSAIGANVLDPNRLQRYIEKAMLAMVRDALRRSYQKSGLITRSGKLKRALDAVEVKIVKGKLKISMEASNVILTQGSSLNYGAIRHGADLGKKAKRTLKQAMLQGRALTERELRRYTMGVNQVHKGTGRIVKREALHGKSAGEVYSMLEGKLGAKMSIGGTTVIRPHPFFVISAADRKRIYEKFTELYQAYLNGTLNRPATGGA